MTFYQPHHEFQLARTNTQATRRSGCTWTSGATGADAATGGHKDRTPDYVHTLVKASEETSPATPGWSLKDLALAMKRLGVGFEDRSGQGWQGVVAAHNAGLYIVLQGDSDRFGNETCSGSFDGDHAIGIRPVTSVGGKWLIDDPICPDDRYETVAVLAAYARKFSPGIRFGAFTSRVPQLGSWTASVSPIPPAKLRQVFTYDVLNPNQRPLLVTGRTTIRTAGFTAACTEPINCRRDGLEGKLPAALVRLTTGARKGQYIDSRFAVES